MGSIAEDERLAEHFDRATDPHSGPRTNGINGCWRPSLQNLPTAYPDCQSYQAQLFSSQKFVWPGHERWGCRQFQAVSHTRWKDSWVGLVAVEEDTDQKGEPDEANSAWLLSLALYVLQRLAVILLDQLLIMYTASYTNCWSRCPRTCALGPRSSAVFEGSP